MASSFRCVRKQLPESDGNEEATLKKGDTNPLDVTLEGIAEKILSLLNEDESLQNAKKEIEKKYEINGDWWSADDVKRVWGQTQRINMEVSERRWAHVIILQMLIRHMANDGCKPNAAHDNTTDENKQSCKTRPGMQGNSEYTSSPAELETAGVEQMFGVISDISKLSDVSGVVSGSQLLSSSTDEDPSPTDVENMHDPENDLWEESLCSTDDINQACGKAERMKGNSQSSDGLETVEAAGEAKQSSWGKHTVSNSDEQTNIGRQGGTGDKDTANDIGAGNSQSGADGSATQRAHNENIGNEYNYIYIPFSHFGSELTSHQSQTQPDENTNSNADGNLNYNLMDGVPSNTQDNIYRKKSYVMQYDSDKKNAKWVYEILNKSTVPFNYKKQVFKKDNEINDKEQALESKTGFENKDYERGHLAAADNHKWCEEAYADTYVISNMTPQISSLNKGIWKSLENYCRNKIHNDRVCNVHVYTGPLYLNSDKKLNGKAVPTHHFKVVIIESVDGKAKVECYKVENKKKESETTDNTSGDNKKKKRKKEKVNDHISDINTIEENCGLTFTRKSEKNERVIVKKTLEITGENGSKRATVAVKIVDV